MTYSFSFAAGEGKGVPFPVEPAAVDNPEETMLTLLASLERVVVF